MLFALKWCFCCLPYMGAGGWGSLICVCISLWHCRQVRRNSLEWKGGNCCWFFHNLDERRENVCWYLNVLLISASNIFFHNLVRNFHLNCCHLWLRYVFGTWHSLGPSFYLSLFTFDNFPLFYVNALSLFAALYPSAHLLLMIVSSRNTHGGVKAI